MHSGTQKLSINCGSEMSLFGTGAYLAFAEAFGEGLLNFNRGLRELRPVSDGPLESITRTFAVTGEVGQADIEFTLELNNLPGYPVQAVESLLDALELRVRQVEERRNTLAIAAKSKVEQALAQADQATTALQLGEPDTPGLSLGDACSA